MKLPVINNVITREVRTVYILHHTEKKHQRFVALWTLSRAIAETWILDQYAKKKRCVCGDRVKFCDYYPEERSMKACRMKKRMRMYRVGRWIYRKLKEKGYGVQ